MENSNVENNEKNWKEGRKKWEIVVLYTIDVLDFIINIVYIPLKWTLKFIWQMFFAIPRVPKRFYGFLRLVSCVTILLFEFITGSISAFGEPLMNDGNILHSLVSLSIVLFLLYTFFINILLSVLMIFGFHITHYVWQDNESFHGDNGGSGYRNINKAMEYVDAKMAFKSDMAKEQYLKELFGGKK